MTWLIRHDGVEMSSDDFLIEDLAEVERTTGTPWAMANPMREVKVARAFLAAAMLRAGRSEEETATALGLLTLKHLKRVFTYVPDKDEEEVTDQAPLDRPSPTTRGSSSGEPGRAGRRLKSAGNDLATF